jgi:hypothetical protein
MKLPFRIYPAVMLCAIALLFGIPAYADGTTGTTYIDPATLHVGPGAGTGCATGCAGDPNVISLTNWDVFYNSQGNGNLPIGTPFYLVVATPVYTGSSNSPTVNSPATMFAPYPGGTTTPVNVGPEATGTVMTSATSNTVDLYDAVGITLSTNSSFSFVNMLACDIGTSTGGNACPNKSLQGSGAPLAGVNITAFDVNFWLISTTTFSPGDLLNFTGNLPIGSYVAAVGVNGTEAWAVPFTESGLAVGTSVPEPSSLASLIAGLLALGAFGRHRLLNN